MSNWASGVVVVESQVCQRRKLVDVRLMERNGIAFGKDVGVETKVMVDEVRKSG